MVSGVRLEIVGERGERVKRGAKLGARLEIIFADHAAGDVRKSAIREGERLRRDARPSGYQAPAMVSRRESPRRWPEQRRRERPADLGEGFAAGPLSMASSSETVTNL